MYASVSRYVQLGSFKLYQPEDYVMVIVFVRLFDGPKSFYLTMSRDSSHASSL
jgi:hypothetical protein